MSFSRFLIVFLIIGAALNAEAGIPFMSETVSWDEDILQSDGHILSAHRTATYGADGYGRSGQGKLKQQTIRFVYEGREIKWVNNDLWPVVYFPDILDIVQGMPILVMPVERWGPCEKYNFPQEGMVAFGYRDNRWDRIDVSDLPKSLKVNLLRSTHEIHYWDEYKDKRITPAMKQALERSSWGSTKQGQAIPETSKFYADLEDSCARIHPLPNPQLDGLRQQNIEAELHAQTLGAVFTSAPVTPENVSPEDFRKAKGQWTGDGYLAESCKGIVEKTEPIRHYRDHGSWGLVGYTLILSNGSHVSIQQPNIKEFQAPDLLESVTCDQKLIYTVKRHGIDQIIVHRFSHSGSLVDVLSVTMFDVTQSFPKEKWPMIWEVLLSEKQMLVSLAVYSYPSTADRGGLIEQRRNYAIQLPR